MRRGSRRVAAGFLTVLLVMAACDGGDPPPAPDATETGEEGDPGNVALTPPGSNASPPVFEPDDEVLNVAISDPSTLDPMRIGDPGSVLIARQLFEGLTRWNPLEEKVEAAAAESWKVSNGGRVFTFKLRPGMTYHDGSPVTADDFVFAFDRIALKENASELAYTLERVQGFTEMNQLGTARHLSGLEAPNAETLVIRLSTPYQDLPAVLTHPALVPLQRGVVGNIDTFLSEPIGNGPFQIAEAWRPGRPVLLKAFTGFIDTPELDGLRLIPYPDAAASWLQFIDGALHVTEVPAGQVADAEKRYGTDGFKSLLAGYYYGFNVEARSLKNLKLRRAVNRAIDREEIATSIYKGTMQPPRGIIPAGMPGFQENVCTTLCRYSPDVAKKLIKEVPRKKRFVRLDYTKGQPHESVAKLVRGDLRAVGLRVALRAIPFQKFVKRLRDGKQAMYRLGWIAEFPNPDVFLSALFQSSSPDNHSGFKSNKVDRLLAEAHATGSPTKRLVLYADAEKAILKLAPIVPIGTFVTRWAAQPTVGDIYFDVMGGFDAVGVTLEEAEA